MGAQIAGERKVFVANFALVWLITRMDVHVILQIGWLTETTIANMTLEGPAAVVHVHVRLEITWCGKTLRAQVALVRFLLVVGHSVVV